MTFSKAIGTLSAADLYEFIEFVKEAVRRLMLRDAFMQRDTEYIPGKWLQLNVVCATGMR